jgi:hypothetical protein
MIRKLRKTHLFLPSSVNLLVKKTPIHFQDISEAPKVSRGSCHGFAAKIATLKTV